MPGKKKYAQAPQNIGPSSIKNSVVPKNIKLSSNPDEIAQYYEDNKSVINEAERNFLLDLYNNARHIEYLKEQKQYVQSKENKLTEENGTVFLPDITLGRKQDTGNGCWSCSYELLLQSKGIYLDQKNIRSYRPDVSSNIEDEDVRGLLEDKMYSVGELADLAIDVLPNTAVISKSFTVTLPGPTEDLKAQDLDDMTTALINSAKETITKHHTPVSLSNGRHFITVVGVDDQGNFLCKDSYGKYKEFDPNYTYKYSVKEYIKNYADALKGYNNDHKPITAISIEMTHLEQLELENGKVQNFNGTGLENRIDYIDGSAFADYDFDSQLFDGSDVAFSSNVKGKQIGNKTDLGGLSIIEKAYLPQTLTEIKPKPVEIEEENEFNLLSIDEEEIEENIFDKPFGVDYQKQSPMIAAGNYRFANLLALNKEDREDFLGAINRSVESQSKALKSAAEKRPELARMYDIAAKMLKNVEQNLIECSNQGRISDSTIYCVRYFMAATEIFTFASQKGNEAAANRISALSDEELYALVNLVGNQREVTALLGQHIQSAGSFRDLIENSITYSQRLYKTIDLSKMANSLGVPAIRNAAQKTQAYQPQVKQGQPQPAPQQKSTIAADDKFSRMTQQERNTYSEIIDQAVTIRINAQKELSMEHREYKTINEFAGYELRRINREIAGFAANGGNLPQAAINGVRDLLAVYQISSVVKNRLNIGDKEFLNKLNALDIEDFSYLVTLAAKSDALPGLIDKATQDPDKFIDVVSDPETYGKELAKDINFDIVNTYVDQCLAIKQQKQIEADRKLAEELARQEMQGQQYAPVTNPQPRPMPQQNGYQQPIFGQPAPNQFVNPQPQPMPQQNGYQQPIFGQPAPNQFVNPQPQPIPQQNKAMQQPDNILFMARSMIKQSIKELESAKTLSNSDEYKGLIDYLKELNDPKKFYGLNMYDKLQVVGSKIDKYISHKAADGVKANTYKKLAAVQNTNKWISMALKRANIDRPMDYKEALEQHKQNNGNTKGLPEAYKGNNNPYNGIWTKVSRDDPSITRAMVENADNCICTIMLKADVDKRPALAQLRNEFNKTNKLEVQKQEPQMGPIR